MKILVVDDEKLLVKGIKFNLENEGYQVETAFDGAAAVELGLLGGEEGANRYGPNPLRPGLAGT